MTENTATAAPLPLFYNSPEALDKEKHAKLSLSKEITFSFAKNTMAVPINVVEFPHILLHYPIAFSTGDKPTPLAIVGLKENENLFVNNKGEWEKNTYIPAYVRRYPFILAQDDVNQRMALCVDNSKGVLAKGHKNAFFDKGETTKLTENALEFCRSYQRAAVDTEQFIKELMEEGLLTENNAQVRMPDGKITNIAGFMVVDEAKLRGLSAEKLEKFHKSGALQLMYAQLMSGGNWQKLFHMMPESQEKK